MAATSREFFTAKSVAEALSDFRPPHRTAPETVSLEEAAGRVPVADVIAGEALPGFDRSAVDGYAVHAQDTFGASESIPAYLTVAGSVAMGAPAGIDLPAQSAVARSHRRGAPGRRRRRGDGRAHPGGDARHDRGRPVGRARRGDRPCRRRHNARKHGRAGRRPTAGARHRDAGRARHHPGRGSRPSAGNDPRHRRRADRRPAPARSRPDRCATP